MFSTNCVSWIKFPKSSCSSPQGPGVGFILTGQLAHAGSFLFRPVHSKSDGNLSDYSCLWLIPESACPQALNTISLIFLIGHNWFRPLPSFPGSATIGSLANNESTFPLVSRLSLAVVIVGGLSVSCQDTVTAASCHAWCMKPCFQQEFIAKQWINCPRLEVLSCSL